MDDLALGLYEYVTALYSICTAFAKKKWYYIIYRYYNILLYKFDDLALGLYKYFDSVRAFIVFVTAFALHDL